MPISHHSARRRRPSRGIISNTIRNRLKEKIRMKRNSKSRSLMEALCSYSAQTTLTPPVAWGLEGCTVTSMVTFDPPSGGTLFGLLSQIVKVGRYLVAHRKDTTNFTMYIVSPKNPSNGSA